MKMETEIELVPVIVALKHSEVVPHYLLGRVTGCTGKGYTVALELRTALRVEVAFQGVNHRYAGREQRKTPLAEDRHSESWMKN